jgi:hypothetical protein
MARASVSRDGWVAWFAGARERAVVASEKVVQRTRAATYFWDRHKDVIVNARQKKVLWRLLGQFEGDLNLRKYIAIASEGRGKATRYRLAITSDRWTFAPIASPLD